MSIKFQLERFHIVFLSCMISTNTLFGMQTSLNDFLHENKKFVIGAAVISAIAIPTYLYYKKALLKNRITKHMQRTKEQSSKNNLFQQFVAMFSPPDNLLKILVPAEQLLYEDSMKFNYDSSLVMAKSTDLSRIIIAHRMNNYIQQKGYSHVKVPKKYIFLTGDIWTVIAERITEKKEKHIINLQQMKEAIDIVENMGYSDFGDKNLMFDPHGILFFIDTEEKSFISPIGKYHWGCMPSSTLKMEDKEAFCQEKYINLEYFNSYLNKYGYIPEEQAQRFLESRIQLLKNEYEKYETSTITYTKVTGRIDLDNGEVDITALNEYIQPLIQQTRGIHAKPRTYFNNPQKICSNSLTDFLVSKAASIFLRAAMLIAFT